MKKFTSFTFLMLFVAIIFAQTLDKAPFNVNASNTTLKSTNSGWTLQFGVNISTQPWGAASAGIETDGTNIYVAKWSSNKFYKLTIAGALVDSFAVTGSPAFPASNGVRDLAYDGQYFYGSCNNNIIYKMDFTAHTIIGSITLPTGVTGRHISYDPNADGGQGGFWVGGWSTDIKLYSRTGTVLNTIPAAGLGTFSAYGSAYDSVSPGGPYLWLYSQTGSNGNELIQVKISTKLRTGLVHDVAPDLTGLPSGSLAGGCFLKTNLITGTTTLGGLVQGSVYWGYDLASTLPPTNGFKVNSLNLPAYALINTPQTLSGVLNNYGATTITSFNLNYTVNGGTTVTQNITGTSITTYSNYNYSHSTPWTTPASSGSYTVKLWASNINGNATLYSDTITKIVTTGSSLAHKKVLFEEFSTEACPNCPPVATYLHGLAVADTNIIMMVHHAGYYTDPYTIPENTAMLAMFNDGGSTFAPAGMADRYYWNADMDNDGTNDPGPVFWPGTPYGSNAITARKTAPAFVSVNIGGSFNTTTRELTVTVSGNITANFASGLGVSLWITQDNITTTAQAGYTGTWTHHSLIRDAISGTWGDAILTPTTDGSTYTKTFTYTVNAAWVLADLELVAMVNQIDAANVNNRTVYNVNSKKVDQLQQIISVSEIKSGVDFSIYPNPATDNMQVNFNLNEAKNVNISIYNTLGALVFSNNKGQLSSGNHAIDINVSSLAKGVYYMKLQAGENNISKKLVIE